MGDADAVHRHPIDCGLEGSQKFRYIQLLDVLDGDHIPVVRDRLSIKANRVGDTDGEIAIGAQVKLRIVKAGKIYGRGAGRKLEGKAGNVHRVGGHQFYLLR